MVKNVFRTHSAWGRPLTLLSAVGLLCTLGACKTRASSETESRRDGGAKTEKLANTDEALGGLSWAQPGVKKLCLAFWPETTIQKNQEEPVQYHLVSNPLETEADKQLAFLVESVAEIAKRSDNEQQEQSGQSEGQPRSGVRLTIGYGVPTKETRALRAKSAEQEDLRVAELKGVLTPGSFKGVEMLSTSTSKSSKGPSNIQYSFVYDSKEDKDSLTKKRESVTFSYQADGDKVRRKLSPLRYLASILRKDGKTGLNGYYFQKNSMSATEDIALTLTPHSNLQATMLIERFTEPNKTTRQYQIVCDDMKDSQNK